MLIGWFSALLVGLSLGLCGAGGSILAVPILVYFMGIAPIDATVDSLMIVGITASFSAWHDYKHGHIQIPIAMQFIIPSLLTIYAVRMYLIPNIPDVLYQTPALIIQRDSIIMLIFSLIMLMAARAMLRPKAIASSPSSSSPPYGRIAMQAVLLGALIGLVGAGGGFIIVPALVGLLGLSMAQAVGTSLLIISVNTLIGFVIGVQSGSHIDMPIIIGFTALALLGSWFGKRIAAHIHEATLKKTFAFMIYMIACFILLKNVWSMIL